MNSATFQNLISRIVQKYSSTEPNVYYVWLVLYIVGDRLKSDKLLKTYYHKIMQTAFNNIAKYGIKEETVYRGFLLEPSQIDTLNVWKYNHNSFTTDKEVAIAFSTNDSDYGIVFPDNYVGKIYEIKINLKEHFIWFDYRWDLPEDIRLFIDYWNQKEIIIGKLEDVIGNSK